MSLPNNWLGSLPGWAPDFLPYATSAGRVLLAYADKEKAEKYFNEVTLEALTEKTVTTKKEMKSILNKVRKNRYSSTDGQLDFGVVSVAVPIFNEDNTIIASISCSTASARCSEQEMIEQIVPELQEAASDIEFELRRCPILAHSIMEWKPGASFKSQEKIQTIVASRDQEAIIFLTCNL